MVKASMILIGAIPVFFAILIAVSLVARPEIPTSAVGPEDKISIEYTKHQLRVVSFGITGRAGSVFTEILTVNDDGDTRYHVVEEGFPQPEKKSKISEEKLRKLTAIIKETGFMEIPTDSFPVREGTEEYQKSTIKVTLNGQTRQIHWPEQNATDSFVPPIITRIETELDQIIRELE